MTLLDHALAYAKRGALIFPVNADKTPATDNGFYDATSDAAQINAWWRRNPNYLIGCRIPDGLVVLDIDPRHNGDAVWRELEKSYHPIELGRRHHSGRNDGGFHAWFRHPGGKLSTKALTEWADKHGVAGHTDNGKPTCGIDILHHEYRYTILPPSPHKVTGQPYAWDNEGKPAIMPPWLASILEPPTPAPPAPRIPQTSDSDSIADWYTDTARWADILTGWTLVHGDGETDGSKWKHPTATASWSATIRHGCLFVYTPNTDFDETEPSSPIGYTKFKAYATLNHGGDMSAAGRELRNTRNDHGTPPTPRTTPAAAADQTDQTEWPEPVAIADEARPPFPLHIFPDWIADQAAQAAEEMQLTPDLAAQLAITALSIVTAGRVEIRVNGRWREWTNTYTVTSLPPSAGKSPTVGMMTGVLDRWEEELAENAERLIDERDLDRKHLEKQRDDAMKRGEVTEAKVIADQLRELPPIVAPRLMADDATPEKLVDLLHQQGGRLSLVSTEGGLFGMMVGRYSDKANLDVYLGAWSGDTIRVDRVERGSTVVRRPRLTIGLTVQPSVLIEVGRNRELVGRGLTARFMYSRPMDTVGSRDKTRESTYSDTVEERYERQMLAIAHRLDKLPADEPLRLEFSPDARRRFLQWTAGREDLLKPFGPLRHMAEWVAKCDSTTARLAGLIHIADGTDDTTIGVDVIDRAIAVGDYWTEHARSTFDIMGASDDLGHARYIHDWLEARTDTPREIRFRDIQQHTKKRVAKAADIVPAIELLIEHGWLRPEFDGSLALLIGKGKSSPTFTTHPRLRTSPTVPHIPHSNAESDGMERNTTLCGRVGDVGDVSHKHPCEINSSLNERKEPDAPKSGPTSPTSADDIDDDYNPFR